MKNLKDFGQFINELFTFGDKENLEGKYIVSIKSKLWVFDLDDFDQYRKAIAKELKVPADQIADYSDLTQLSEDIYPNVICGQIEDNDLVLNVNSDMRHSRTSPDIVKIFKELNLSNLKINHRGNGEDDDTYDFREYISHNYQKLKEEFFYHGTSLKAFQSIVKKGILPRNKSYKKSNYDRINHDDKIFTTLNKEKAASHAFMAAEQQKSFPIVIVHNIPDPSLLDLDYDVAVQFYGKSRDVKRLGYDIVAKKANVTIPRAKRNVKNLNNKLGIFSYRGRIPASYIQGVLIPLYSYAEYFSSVEFGEKFDLNNQVSSHVGSWVFLSLADVMPRIHEIEQEYYDEFETDDEEQDVEFAEEDDENSN